MDELIPDDYFDPEPNPEDQYLEEAMKAGIAAYYRARFPHLGQPHDPWIRPTEGETP